MLEQISFCVNIVYHDFQNLLVVLIDFVALNMSVILCSCIFDTLKKKQLWEYMFFLVYSMKCFRSILE